MIVGFLDPWLRAFFVDDVGGKEIPADIADRLFRKLQIIDDATTIRACACHPATKSRRCGAI